MRSAISIHTGSLLGSAKAIVPLVRLVATVGFAIAPGALGFAIIGAADQLINRLLGYGTIPDGGM
jgi:hypothetical protein